MERGFPNLPISGHLERIVAELQTPGILVLSAPPGSGKTTVLPLALLAAPWLGHQKIIVQQPRRMAAKLVAERMAALLGEGVGEGAGYRIRYDQKVSSRTRIEVVTDGLLTRLLQSDPGLDDIGVLVFDEFHERSLQSDMNFAFAREIQQTLRPDLRIVLMSATLDESALLEQLPDAKLVRVETRPFPVSVEYTPPKKDEDYLQACARAVERTARRDSGDVLVFLPGVGEINKVHRLLSERLLAVEIHDLHSGTSADAERAILSPRNCDESKSPRIILATSIAETSITLPAVTTVIDGGKRRFSRFDPSTGFSELVTESVTFDAAEQRRGRAGRVGPGHCIRLWNEGIPLRPFHAPEIMVADLAQFALELAAWGVSDLSEFPLLTPPPSVTFAGAERLLQQLDALEMDDLRESASTQRVRISPIGKEMARLGCHPRLARLLLVGRSQGLREEACFLVAYLEDESQRRAPQQRHGLPLAINLAHVESEFRSGKSSHALRRGIDTWQGRLRSNSQQSTIGPVPTTTPGFPPSDRFGYLLAHAYPERIAQRQESRGTDLAARQLVRYRLADGQGVTLHEHDSLAKFPYLVAAHISVRTKDSPVRLAAEISEATLRRFAEPHLRSELKVYWDEQEGAAYARENETYESLVLRERNVSTEVSDEIFRVSLEALSARGGLRALHWDDSADELTARLEFVRRFAPDVELPNLDGATLAGTLELALSPFREKLRRRATWADCSASEILLSQLSWAQRKELDRLAPSHLTLPRGRVRALVYRRGETPVLQATVQELFGWSDGPKILGGRVPLSLHVLSPARRPVQVTQDLAGFWKSSYAEVRKELRGRYPKHDWPENPLDFNPERTPR